MRRQYNGRQQNFNNNMGFSVRFPPEFDDPFRGRNYDKHGSFRGGALRSLIDLDLEYDMMDHERPYPNDRARFSGPDNNFGGGNWGRNSSNMSVDSFLQMGHHNNNRRNPYNNRRDYDGNDFPQQQLNQSQFPCEIDELDVPGDDMQIENTRNGNNFTSFDEEIDNREPTVFPIRKSITDLVVPAYDEKEDKQEKQDKEVKCKVCNISLTSKQVFEQHILGKKHLKKEADAKKYSCELCCTQMFTMEDQKAHNETEQHQESVKVAEFFEKQRSEDPDLQRAKALMYKEPTLLTQADINAIKAASAKEELKYGCDLCNVSCNSTQMLQLHLNSKKHIKKSNEQKLNSKSAAIQYSCDMCKFLCYSQEEHEKHSNSDEHAKVLSAKLQAGTLQSPVVPKEVIAACIPKDELDVIPHKSADNVLWYTCTTCNVKTNSLDNHKAHINSKKHKAKVKQPGAVVENKKTKYSSEALRNSYTRFVSSGGLGKKITGDPGSYCARCEIQFKSSAELEEHFMTLAHKNHNPYKKKLCFDSETATTAKKSKLNNGTSIPKVVTTKTVAAKPIEPVAPVPTSDYGYGSYDNTHQQYPSNYGYQTTGYQTQNSAYPTNYQTSYGYDTSGYGGYYQSYQNHQPAYQTQSQPTSYTYSAPYYQQ